MKYLLQFGAILAVSLFGELLHQFIPLPVPASIWGLITMLILLVTGAIKLEKIEETADFLISIMPLMFIPAIVGLLDSYTLILPDLLGLIILTVLTTVIVMAVCGRVSQAILRARERKNDE
ncbi:MAG: CidA/LrgA family protein [Clostridia bacterium]|nr:CidA/LrgA family protein [Clostridia bacterium]